MLRLKEHLSAHLSTGHLELGVQSTVPLLSELPVLF